MERFVAAVSAETGFGLLPLFVVIVDILGSFVRFFSSLSTSHDDVRLKMMVDSRWELIFAKEESQQKWHRLVLCLFSTHRFALTHQRRSKVGSEEGR